MLEESHWGLMKGASSSLRAAFSHCVQQVRSYDYHHYLCLLELPANMRKAAFALRAFNVETARAMDVASDPKIGLMRLLWWQEAIDKIYANKLIEHPTAQALSSVISESKISKAWLKRVVDARINDANRDVIDLPESIEELEKYAEDTASTLLYMTLQAGGIKSTAVDHAASHVGKASGLLLLLKDVIDLPESIEELEKYAEDTASTLLYMTLQAGGIKSTAVDHAASHVGKASGLLLLLKSLPYHASRNRHFSYIPAKLAAKHGLLVKEGGRSEIRLDSREGLCDAVFEMASVANAHLVKARELANSVPVEARKALLPAVPAQVLLDSLSKVQFDVFDSRLARGVLGRPPLWFQLKLKWYSWRGIY
ncbi:hypothetical protein GOBAR_AA13365 [Gossypium barbadense]|uniref:Phytoene synthase n=1 Tax=Gossypium barbadense TaxID=3634 RepID=A0A2P5XVB4_GOSBA|nr:hypothetical protein GOBAR_AA13365 [Gossypium barbadense]